MKKPDPETVQKLQKEADEDSDMFGFRLPEEGWMSQCSQLCAADDLDEDGVVRWTAWLESRPPGLIAAELERTDDD